MPGKVDCPPSGVDCCVRAPAPRAFAGFLLPLGALPGPRRRAVASYAHSPPRLMHALHFGLSPLQPSFRPEGGELRQRHAKKNTGLRRHPQSAISAYGLVLNFIQRHLPLQKLHAISVFFLNLRNGVNPSSNEPLTLCFPLHAIFM